MDSTTVGLLFTKNTAHISALFAPSLSGIMIAVIEFAYSSHQEITVQILTINLKSGYIFVLQMAWLACCLLCFQDITSAQNLEEKILTGETTTAEEIVSDHPRLWMKGEWDWDPNNVGSFAWRIVHGAPKKKDDPTHDDEKYEFYYCICGIDYGADYMYGQTRDTYRERFLEQIIAAKAKKSGWLETLPTTLPSSSMTFSPQHSADEYFSDAREKLLWAVSRQVNEYALYTVFYGAVGYDWLINENYSNGTPVLSTEDQVIIQQSLITNADYLKTYANGQGHFFKSGEVAAYLYPMVGLALYEADRQQDTSYALINAKAKEYLDDFDTYWVGKILPALNEQGGDGGWHGGITKMQIPWRITPASDQDATIPEIIAPLLFAHYTATNFPIEESLFSTGVIKYLVEFQNCMIRPSTGGYADGVYYEIGGAGDAGTRPPWIFPLRTYSRRRFSANAEQLKLAELGDWIASKYQTRYTNAGSWDMLDQLLFEDKWANPRQPTDLGYGTRFFQKLGWVFMRTGFGSADDLAALFICQRYHWSHLDPYAQNSFTLEYKGELIQGFNNTLLIDSQNQRTITNFPTISQGIEPYMPASAYDVGPGILKFETKNNYDYVFGDATNAYDTNKLEKYTRQIVFLKPDLFVVLDFVVTKEINYSKSWLINPGATPESVGENLLQIKNGAGALWLKRLLPDTVILESQTSESYQICPAQANYEDIFLFVLQATDSDLSINSPAVIADNAALQKKADTLCVTVENWEIFFPANGDTGIVIKDKNATPNYSAAGKATYFSSDAGVPNVVLELVGGESNFKNTDASGFYEFNYLAINQAYTITPHKDGDIFSNTILAYDAALTARIAVNLFPSATDYQRKAADVDKDGNVYMYDAALIARYAVGLPALPNSFVGDWYFSPQFLSIPSLNANIDSLNFSAVVLGDIDGNWAPQNIQMSGQLAENIFIAETSTWKNKGEQLTLPFIPAGGKEIYSFDISLSFNPNLLHFAGTSTSSLIQDFHLIINDAVAGNLQLCGYGIQPITTQGVLFEVAFEIIGDEGESGELKLEKLYLNNESAKSSTTKIFVGADPKEKPDKFILFQNYPNPFNPLTTIKYEIANNEPARTVLNIFNVNGELVKTLVDKIQTANFYSVEWRGDDNIGKEVGTGLYLIQLKSVDFIQIKKMIKLR